jgi:hypothetical protein
VAEYLGVQGDINEEGLPGIDEAAVGLEEIVLGPCEFELGEEGVTLK